MKILLVSPIRDQHQFTNRGILIPQLALFILQGLTPKQHEVKIVEEEYMQLDLNEECDVVGISCMTSNAYRGYRIADAFRENGKKVVMGGVHPSLLPDEALEHANAVVIGEAEGVWEKILEDIESNNLQRIYHEPKPDLDRYVPKDFSTLPKKRFYNLIPIQTTRGCPYNCDFCCVSDIFGFDEDTHETFGQTVKFLIKNRLSIAAINVLTAYPGTRVFKEFKEEGRLLHEKWEYYDHHTVVFQPKNMMPLELQIGKIKARAAFNSIPSIIKRFIGNLRIPGLYLATNLYYRNHTLKESKRLRQFESQMQPDSGNGMDLDIFIKDHK